VKDRSRILAPVNTLSLREAAGRYNVPKSTLSDWVESGQVRVARHAEKRGQAMLLVEPDVAQLAAEYKPGRGPRRKPLLLEAIAKA
jgi:transposase